MFRAYRGTALLVALLGAVAVVAADQGGGSMDRLNVLMIAVDDLRPELGCYGAGHMHTPNIDKLANAGTVFMRAYCQQAVCSPSRTSLLTGLRPDSTRIYDLNTHFRKTIPDVVALPEQFKRHGYHTQGIGKIYHGDLDDPQSWSVPHWMPGGPAYRTPEALAMIEEQRRRIAEAGRQLRNEVLERDPKTGAALRIRRGARVRGPSWETPDVPDKALGDGKVADRAIEALREIKGKPFFLAVGFFKPHLPFVAPKKYFDLYPPESITLPANGQSPVDAPALALTHFGELRNYSDIPNKGPISEEKARELIRAYRAAASFTDAQIGRVLDELDRLGLRERTIVVLWGDHGWHLGEQGLWCKHTNFENATHAPLILSAPGQRGGTRTMALSEFVDVYPTLCELAGVPAPGGLEGTSLVPLLKDPEHTWKKAAFSQYPRGAIMGYSIRTDRFRYTEWTEPGKEPAARELYDHQRDPRETVNLAGLPEHENLVKELSRTLRAGWQAAVPQRAASER